MAPDTVADPGGSRPRGRLFRLADGRFSLSAAVVIWDLLSNEKLYRHLHPRFALSFDWLARFDPAAPDGRIELDGERVFALVQSYTTAPAEKNTFETHRERIDIQYIVRGTELMLCAPAGSLQETTPYNPSRDAAFYADPDASTRIVCGPGSFVIFFPHDGHKGGCTWQTPDAIRKVVIKVRVS